MVDAIEVSRVPGSLSVVSVMSAKSGGTAVASRYGSDNVDPPCRTA